MSSSRFPCTYERQVYIIISPLYWAMVGDICLVLLGGGPRVVVSTAAFHARVRGSVPGLGGFKETKMFLPHPRVKVSIVGSLRDREVACSASDRQGSNFESCVWRTVSSQSSHHPQEVLLAQFSLYGHKGGLKPDSFHFCLVLIWSRYAINLCCAIVSSSYTMSGQHKCNFGSASFICVIADLLSSKNLHSDCNNHYLFNVGTSSQIADYHEPSAGSSFLLVCTDPILV